MADNLAARILAEAFKAVRLKNPEESVPYRTSLSIAKLCQNSHLKHKVMLRRPMQRLEVARRMFRYRLARKNSLLSVL